MGDLPLRTPTHRRLGGPLPRQPANGTHPHRTPGFTLSSQTHARPGGHAVLTLLSQDCPAVRGRSDTRYSPVRRSPPGQASLPRAAPRLACVKPVASVHPEPGSNSSSYSYLFFPFFRFGKGTLHHVPPHAAAGRTTYAPRALRAPGRREPDMALSASLSSFMECFQRPHANGEPPRKRVQKYSLFPQYPNFYTPFYEISSRQGKKQRFFRLGTSFFTLSLNYPKSFSSQSANLFQLTVPLPYPF